MKRIINGKTYNTDTANYIDDYSNGLGNRDFNNINEELYITDNGVFFLSGSGGPMTKYSHPVGNMTSGGSDIFPLSKIEALSWMECHGKIEDIEEYFSDLVEDA